MNSKDTYTRRSPINGYTINIDIVIPIRCSDLHINVQDASGDQLLAGDALTRDRTYWYQCRRAHVREWRFRVAGGGEKRIPTSNTKLERFGGRKRRENLRELLGRMGWKACRIYGKLEGNKVQGDFHITARGHGYMEFGEHLDHTGTFRSVFCTYDWSISLVTCCLIFPLILGTAAGLTGIFVQLSISPI